MVQAQMVLCKALVCLCRTSTAGSCLHSPSVQRHLGTWWPGLICSWQDVPGNVKHLCPRVAVFFLSAIWVAGCWCWVEQLSTTPSDHQAFSASLSPYPFLSQLLHRILNKMGRWTFGLIQRDHSCKSSAPSPEVSDALIINWLSFSLGDLELQ